MSESNAKNVPNGGTVKTTNIPMPGIDLIPPHGYPVLPGMAPLNPSTWGSYTFNSPLPVNWQLLVDSLTRLADSINTFVVLNTKQSAPKSKPKKVKNVTKTQKRRSKVK